MILASTLVYVISIMPIGQQTLETKDLFKPFSVEEFFASEAECNAAAKATLKAHLQMRGLPKDTSANYTCTATMQN